LRVECADTFYHVLSRGNERRPVFTTDRDYAHFTELLGDFAERFDVEIWSYVLMKNHYHLIIMTHQPNLSRAMHWLGASYSMWFNVKHGRAGHLFQGRFKSFVVEEEDYLRRLILYVHRNPLRAGVADRLADYRWSSYRHLAYRTTTCPCWLRRKAVLSAFGNKPSHFRKAVRDYCDEDDCLLENLRRGLILGSSKGIALLRRKVKETPHIEKPQFKAMCRNPAIEHVARRFQKTMRLSDADVQALRRPRRRAIRPERDLLIHLLGRRGIYSTREIALYFGVTPSAVHHAYARARALLSSQKKLERKIQKLFNSLFKM